MRFTAMPNAQEDDLDGFLDLTLVSPKAPVQAKRVEVNRNRFAGLLKSLYRQLSRQEAMTVEDPSTPARQLHALLLEPLQEAFQGQQIQTLLIAADQGLQAVPFAALSDGSDYFGNRYAFSLTPSLALTQLAPAPAASKRQLALGASQFEVWHPCRWCLRSCSNSTDGADRYLNDDFTPQSLWIELLICVTPGCTWLPMPTSVPGTGKSVIHTGSGPMSMAQFAFTPQDRISRWIWWCSVPVALSWVTRTVNLALRGWRFRRALGAIGTFGIDDVVTSAFFVQFSASWIREYQNPKPCCRPASCFPLEDSAGGRSVLGAGDIPL